MIGHAACVNLGATFYKKPDCGLVPCKCNVTCMCTCNAHIHHTSRDTERYRGNEREREGEVYDVSQNVHVVRQREKKGKHEEI